MTTHATRTQFTSTDPAFQGVTFHFRKPTEGRRIALNLAMAEAKSILREHLTDSQTLAAEAEAQGESVDPKLMNKIQDASEKIESLISSVINPTWIRTYLDKIDGLSFDDEPATVESFIENAPVALYNEVLVAIRKTVELSAEERKN